MENMYVMRSQCGDSSKKPFFLFTIDRVIQRVLRIKTMSRDIKGLR